MYITKRIYLNTKKTKYCIVRLYSTKKQMNGAYLDLTGCKDGVYGVSIHDDFIDNAPGRTGYILLSKENCGAGLVSHEFMHAILWAHNHRKKKKQYPVIITSMAVEERILHNLSFAVAQFYTWFFKESKRLT